MRRRGFIVGIGAAALGSPLRSFGQEPTPAVGFLNTLSPEVFTRRIEIFRLGLAEAGYTEGRNVRVEYRWAGGDYRRLPALAAEIVRLRVAVIVTTGGAASAQAAQRATSTIPIVFTSGGDPVKLGLVASLNRPGGNATGVSVRTGELVANRLELLKEIAPTAAVIGMLTNPNSATAVPDVAAAREAAHRLGREIAVAEASAENEFASAFATLAQKRTGALLVDGDPLYDTHAGALIALAAQYSLPAIYSEPDFSAAGGLVSYGPRVAEAYRQAGVYAGRILGGEKPGDLPVVLLSKVELAVNLETAKALGLAPPPSLLARADEVIE